MSLSRREFLQRLGLVAVAAATPKFIFDMGANLYKPDNRVGEITILTIEAIRNFYEQMRNHPAVIFPDNQGNYLYVSHQALAQLELDSSV